MSEDAPETPGTIVTGEVPPPIPHSGVILKIILDQGTPTEVSLTDLLRTMVTGYYEVQYRNGRRGILFQFFFSLLFIVFTGYFLFRKDYVWAAMYAVFCGMALWDVRMRYKTMSRILEDKKVALEMVGVTGELDQVAPKA